MQGLEGLRVVELGEMVAAAYAGKLIADLGGDVVKVEPPSGDRARMRGPFPSHVRSDQGRHDASGLYLYLNTNKRSVVLDLATPRGREQLDQLIEGADLVIHNLPRAAVDALGLAPEALLAQWPALVVCSITPFGLEGPYSRYRAEEITTSHAGGWAALTPGACEHPDAPPLKTFGHQADFQAATAGAAAAVAACLRALRTGQGEAIDLCSQAHIAGMLEAGFITETYRGETPTRFGRRTLNPWKIFECRDGLIFLATIEQDQWERLVAFMGNPDWTQLEVFADFPGRMQNVDLVESMIQEWIATWRVDDLYHEGQKHRICFAPVLSLAELAQQDQLAERDFFVTVDHPVAGPLPHLAAPYRLGEAWWKLRTPAPRLGEHDAEVLGEGDAENPVAADNQRAWRTPRSVAMPDRPSPRAGSEHPADRPLEGVRVLDFSWVWAGPYCAMQLAHLGAEVIKIESEARPDLGRRLPFFPPDTPRTLDASGYFNQWNQGKRSVRLDLSQEPAREIARAIASHCDVVVDNYSPGVMTRLGLDHESLRARRPDIITASISGYGQTGPRSHYMAYGPAIGPLAGLSSLTGFPDGPPQELGIALGDPTAGIHAAFAIGAALLARERTGAGQRIDVSLWEATAALAGEGWMEFAMTGSEPARRGNRDHVMAPHGCYRCAGEDHWVTIACAGDEEWGALAAVVAPDLANDPRFETAELRKRNEDALDTRLAEWTAAQDRWDVTRRLQAVGVAAFPTFTTADLASDPHLEARGFLERLPHPVVGRRTHAGIPWRLARGGNGVRAPAPLLGADTQHILGDLLGYTPEHIDRLREDGVLH